MHIAWVTCILLQEMAFWSHFSQQNSVESVALCKLHHLRWSQLWPVVGVAALGLSVRSNVFAPLYLLENPRGMHSRISLACLDDAGVYSVLVAYILNFGTLMWRELTCASDMPSSWCLAPTFITTVLLFVCYALGVIVTNNWCVLYCLFCCLCLYLMFSGSVTWSTFEPLNLWLLCRRQVLIGGNWSHVEVRWYKGLRTVDPI